jgi:hypothetical protein
MESTFASPVGSYASPTGAPQVSAIRQPEPALKSQISSWSAKQAYKFYPQGRDWQLPAHVELLDKAHVASVSEAVQMLQNREMLQESSGLSVVYSAKQQTWYLLYRAGMKETALDLLADLGCRLTS